MMRSLFSGVAGLRTHQTKMDVIGNNIANVNTTAYKSQSITFRDLMYQTTQKASGANALTGAGGKNAKQIGLGVTTGAINTAITQQGSAQTTNNPFDVMITGESFFVVSSGQQNFFTRDGSFFIDGAGNLAMTSSGYTVMGWQIDPVTGEPKADTVSALKIKTQANMTYPPEATTEGRVVGIIDKNDTKVNSSSGRTTTLDFYDNLGYKYTAKMSYHSTKTNGNYYVKLDDIVDSNGKSVGKEVMDKVTFGSASLTADVSVNYTPANATLSGTVTVTDGAVAPATPLTISKAIDTEFTPSAAEITAITSIYGVTLAADSKIKISKDGNLTVTEKGTGAGSALTETNFGIKKGSAAFPDGGILTITDKTTPANTFNFNTTANYTVGTDAAADAAVKSLYGLDLAVEGVLEYKVNTDGTLTVTKQSVKNAANVVYNTGDGTFVSVNGNGKGMMTLGFGGIVNFKDVNIDFTASKNLNNGGSSTIGAINGTEEGLGAGRKIGEMSGISIGKDGLITASYDNGMSRSLGQIAVATFANASGLEKAGNNLYSTTMNSGEFDGVGKDITTDSGEMNSGVLEMSNVDLSAEFTEMITTQRGFQANSRIITVSDTMLEELTNLKR